MRPHLQQVECFICYSSHLPLTASMNFYLMYHMFHFTFNWFYELLLMESHAPVLNYTWLISWIICESYSGTLLSNKLIEKQRDFEDKYIALFNLTDKVSYPQHLNYLVSNTLLMVDLLCEHNMKACFVPKCCLSIFFLNFKEFYSA